MCVETLDDGTQAECGSQPCSHGGTCFDSTHSTNIHAGTYLCKCPKERHGPNCEFLVLNVGEQNYLGEFRDSLSHLQSKIVLSEQELSLNLDEILSIRAPVGPAHACVSVPCQHNATCQPHDESYICTCPDGWQDDNCELPSAVACPYLSTAADSPGLDSPCAFEPCVSHSDGCECLLFQWHYCSQPGLQELDPFCVSLLEGMEEHEAQSVLITCMAEIKALRNRAGGGDGSDSPALHVPDLSRPPALAPALAGEILEISVASEKVDDEMDVIFVEAGTLGLKFVPHVQTGAAVVMDVVAGTQATYHPQLVPGLTLRRVGGKDVRGLDYKDVIRTLKDASQTRPLACRFSTVVVSTEKQPGSKKCPVGSFARRLTSGSGADTLRKTSCEWCEAGKADMDHNPRTPCGACEAGQQSEARAVACIDCPPDSYDDDRNPSTPCVPCRPRTPFAPPRSTVCTDVEPAPAPAADPRLLRPL